VTGVTGVNSSADRARSTVIFCGMVGRLLSYLALPPKLDAG
jgi:hypothetical protein